MRARLHLLTGLLTVLALTATAVEGLWASTQRAEMKARTIATASATIDERSIPGCPAEIAHASPSCEEGGNPDVPQCPSMPFGIASSCAGAVAVAAESFPDFEPSPEGIPPLRSTDQIPDQLFALAFFRPPIA